MTPLPRFRASPYVLPAAPMAHRVALPPRRDEPDEEPVPSGWHESSRELRDGLTVVEDLPADELPR